MSKLTAATFPLLLIGLAAGVVGCGTNLQPAQSNSSSTPYASVSGDWRFGNSTTGFAIAAGLVDTTSAVTGTATLYGCGSTPLQTTIGGNVDSSGLLSLETAALPGGGTVSLQGQVSADGKTMASASVSSNSAACSVPAAQVLTGQVYAPATGNYTGTFTGSDGDATPVTATLSQSATAGSGGGYTLSGSVSFASSPCLDNTATINSATSTVTGGALSATYTSTLDGQTVTITATGTATPDASSITISNWTIAGGLCDGYSGTGSLTETSSSS